MLTLLISTMHSLRHFQRIARLPYLPEDGPDGSPSITTAERMTVVACSI